MTEPEDAEGTPADPDVAADAAPGPVPSTGVPAADAAARRLAEIAHEPVDAHVGIYEDVHRRLQEGLADLDEQ